MVVVQHNMRALGYAVQNTHTECLKALVDANAQVDAKVISDQPVLCHALLSNARFILDVGRTCTLQ